jgi:hypothetical protein
MSNLVDTSTLSLSIGAIVFIICTGVSKYMLEQRNKNLSSEDKLDSTYIVGYSMVVGIGLSVIALIMYKQTLVYKGNNDILTDNFYSL